ncbi:GNAT family N-acetyltransferase [Cellulosimicrobium sp. 22601]|uniref:GNAT family N-acetyltransferase n=1 Tax=Cellulosimicrobium sp. 22601 TaxID=3453949 RepID=UPI003F853FAC
MTTRTAREGAPTRDDRVGAPSRVVPSLGRWADHPVVRAERDGWDVLDAVARDDALVVRRAFDAGSAALWGLGTPTGVADLLLDRPDLAAGEVRSSLPRGTTTAAAALGGRTGRAVPEHLRAEPVSRWDWFTATSEPPAQPGEQRVVALDGDEGRARVRAVLDVANPSAELDPSEPGTRWWGWRDETGTVRSVAGARRSGPGVPWSLGGVATDPAARGRGAARAVVAVATRACLHEEGIVVLGMYADNDAARRVYAALGFVVTQEFESRR